MSEHVERLQDFVSSFISGADQKQINREFTEYLQHKTAEIIHTEIEQQQEFS